MIVVGVGVGPGMLTEQAIEKIETAAEVYGSPRSLELAGPYIRGEAKKIKDYKNLHLLGMLDAPRNIQKHKDVPVHHH